MIETITIKGLIVIAILIIGLIIVDRIIQEYMDR